MRRDVDTQPRTLREAFSELTVESLKPLASLVGGVAIRKGEIVDLLAKVLEDPAKLRRLYHALGDVRQKAVQEATHDPKGKLDLFVFHAKYGRIPDFGGEGRRYGDKVKPTELRLFFTDREYLPRDLQTILRDFVPQPPPLTIQTLDDLPAKVRPYIGPIRYPRKEDDEEVELRVRQTARAAMHDVKAILQLIDLGKVRVGDKNRRPPASTMGLLAEVLADGDFYAEEDQSKDEWEPALDLRIQAFAWPMLLQAAGLAEAAGTRLQLTAAGRKAMSTPTHEVIRKIWEKWRNNTLLDEFNRINAIKGQNAKGRVLTAVAPRRKAVAEVLSACPPEKWISTDELFRLLKVLAPDLEVAHDEWKLYLSEPGYGSLGESGTHSWEMLQGRFALALLFEYAATLGLLDVAYIPPEEVRDDYSDCWGADDLSCLSRYDGLLYLRINALGAWCLGLAKHYQPAEFVPEPVLKVLPNRDVVAADRPIAAVDALFLERFAERKSEAVWHLDAGLILESVGKGRTVEELKQFLEARNQGPLPQTVLVFLDDLTDRLGQLEDLGSARLIACKDAHVAQLLIHDRRLRKLCQLAGDRQIVFRAADETAVRRALKELGYVLPPAP